MRVVAGPVLSLLLVAGGPAFGAGYAIYEQGAKAMAEAGAFTARADDPSALFFNPAGILELDGIRVYGGTTSVLLDGSRFGSAATGDDFKQVNMIAWPSSLYYTQKLGKGTAWGFAVTSPFGLKTRWGPAFEGRFISRESNLAVGNLNADLAFRLGPRWSGAIGIDYAKAEIRELSRNLDLSPLGCAGCEGFSQLTGDGTDFGWNAALRFATPSGWRWGASYRSGMKPKIDGRVDFEDIPAPFAALFPNGGATAEIPLPATFATGVGYRSHLGRGNWEVEFDVAWTDWSVFDHLRVDIANNTLAVGDTDHVEAWHDSVSYRAGFGYHLRHDQEWRVGLYWDQTPVPNQHVRPRLPDADRKSVQVGYGWRSKKSFVVDVAYQALFFDDRRAEGSPSDPNDPVQPGLYSNFTSIFGLSLGWNF